MEDREAVEKKFLEYKKNPLLFVEEVLRVPEISAFHHVSDQQKDLLRWTGAKVEANYRSWNHNQLGNTSKPFPEEMQGFAKELGASVMSGKGTGKDACSAWLCIWAICCFENCKVYIVAPNERSIKQILFPEIGKWCDAKLPTGEYAFKLRDYVKLEREMIYFSDVPNPKFDRTIEPIVVSPNLPPDQQTAVLSGRHEKNMFFFFEEACGINDNVFEPIEDTLTSENNFCFQIFNPNRTGGYAIKSQTPQMKPYWHQFRWNAEESTIASKESSKRLEELYGRDSNKYRTNVLGLPPLADEDTLIPHEWVMCAAMNDSEEEDDTPIIMGVDPARYGGDESVILVRQGRKVLDVKRFRDGMDGQMLANRMIEVDVEWECNKAYIDAIGVGASPYDFAKSHFRGRLTPVIVSKRPDNPARFMKLRDELWWRVREWFEEGMCDIPYDEEFIEQLSDIRYEDHGKVKIEGKKELKKRKGNDGSPDIADALCLTFRYTSDSFRQRAEPYTRKRPYAASSKRSGRGWMTA